MTMTTASRANTYEEYLKSFTRVDKETQCTHTRIGNKELNVYGGVYTINGDNLNNFYDIYYQHVFTNKKQEYFKIEIILCRLNAPNGFFMLSTYNCYNVG